MPHTPGPWIMHSELETDPAYIFVDGEEPLAVVPPGRYQHANAQLMASAPDGYALAVHLCALADDAYLVGHPEFIVLCEEARSFLSRVEGRQP